MPEAPTISQPATPSQPVDSGLAAAMQAHIQYKENQDNPVPPPQNPTETAPEKTQPQIDSNAPPETKPPLEGQQKEKKGMWEKLGKTDPPEERKPEGEQEYPEEPPKEQNAWTKIKRELKELKAERAQWQSERPTYEQQLKELKERTSKFSDTDLTDLQKYREEQAIFHVQTTDTYQNEAAKPWNEGNETLRNISEYTKIPADKFKEALMEPNPLVRNREITKILKAAKTTDQHSGEESELDASEIASLAAQVSDAGKKLHDASAAHKRLTDEAALKGQQRATQEEAAKIRAQQESKEVFSRGMKEMTSNMQVQLKDLMEAGYLDQKTFETIAQEDLPTDPMDQIYALHASHMLIPLTQALRQAHAKIAEYEEDRKARMETRPSTRPKPSSGPNGRPNMSLQDAMNAQMRHGLT